MECVPKQDVLITYWRWGWRIDAERTKLLFRESKTPCGLCHCTDKAWRSSPRPGLRKWRRKGRRKYRRLVDPRTRVLNQGYGLCPQESSGFGSGSSRIEIGRFRLDTKMEESLDSENKIWDYFLGQHKHRTCSLDEDCQVAKGLNLGMSHALPSCYLSWISDHPRLTWGKAFFTLLVS